MGRRNMTLQLDDDVVLKAKVMAAKRGTSVSSMLGQFIVEMAEADARYEHAHRLALETLRHSKERGGRHWRRDDLYAG